MERRQRFRLLAVGGGVIIIAFAALVMAVQSRGAPAQAPPAVTASSPSPSVPSGPTLRALAAAHHLVFGSAANTAALRSDQEYRDVLGRQFGALTAEDAMKWASVEPARGVYNWDDADRVVDFARQHHQLVYGHALAWYAALPPWLSTVDSAGTAAVLRHHVEDEVSRYRGKVWAWDVVNEAVNADGSLRDSVWLRALGPDYIAQVFRWAHATDPKATLFLDDFGMEDVNRKSNAVYAMVKALRAQGVPVGGVGFQVHWTTDPLPAGFVANLRRFAALGVQVAITEADVRITLPVTFDKLAAQAAVYRQAVAGCLAVSGCVSFTVWGFTDRYSWIPGLDAATGAACLFDTGLQPKAAYTAVLGALK